MAMTAQGGLLKQRGAAPPQLEGSLWSSPKGVGPIAPVAALANASATSTPKGTRWKKVPMLTATSEQAREERSRSSAVTCGSIAERTPRWMLQPVVATVTSGAEPNATCKIYVTACGGQSCLSRAVTAQRGLVAVRMKCKHKTTAAATREQAEDRMPSGRGNAKKVMRVVNRVLLSG